MTQLASTKIDPIEFRNALGSFVTGVTIVTTRDETGTPVGLTANSFNSVSLDPPLVLWSLGLNSGSLPAFRTAKYWAVHILAANQEALSARFAKRGIDKFEGLALEEGPDGIPLLPGCTARFICRTAYEYEGGDHAIFVGAVEAFGRDGGVPLAFHQGRYASVMAGAAAAIPDEPFGRQFIGHYLGRAHADLLRNVRQEYRKRGLDGRQYTVLTVLGIGDHCRGDEIIRRAAAGGVRVTEATISSLMEKGLLVAARDCYELSGAGRQVVIELIAVAQASQQQVENMLAPGEMAALRQLLTRIIGGA
jgi:3-hydroxy-9,10-secoandrosta-1,3,5(10)-triene-9,17-dione monooxygenase reductase component